MTYIDAFKALSDPTRRTIFELLRTAPQSVGVLAAQLPVSRPAVSQHLKILVEAGLVNANASGNRRIYALRAEGLRDIRDYFDSFWDEALQNYAKEIKGEE